MILELTALMTLFILVVFLILIRAKWGNGISDEYIRQCCESHSRAESWRLDHDEIDRIRQAEDDFRDAPPLPRA